MGATSKTFVDGSPPQCEAADLNGFNLEIKNAIEDSEQVHSTADREQLSKALSNQAANGDFYGDSGAANAYVLSPLGNAKGITAYANGQKIRFKAANPNTGASAAVVNGLSSKAIKDVSGNDLVAGDIPDDEYSEIVYDSVAGYFVLVTVNMKSITIQDFTSVGSIGDANQQNALHLWNRTVLDSILSNWTTLAYFNFPATNLLNDVVGAYNLTGVNVTDANNATGVMGTNFAVDLDGSTECMYHGTLGDNFRTICTQGLAIGICFKCDDGVPAGINYLFRKINVSGQDDMSLYIDTSGILTFNIEVNNGGVQTFRLGYLSNGANPWHTVFICQDATYGLRIYLDGVMADSDYSMTTIVADGTAGDFYIGSESGPANYFDGKLAQFIIANALVTQRDIDFLHATAITEPAVLAGKNYKIRARMRPYADAAFTRDATCEEVARSGGIIYLQGSVRGWSTNQYALDAEVL